MGGIDRRAAFEQRQREPELPEGVDVVLVRAHGLARRSHVVVREEVRERRVADDVANEPWQKLRHDEERAASR